MTQIPQKRPVFEAFKRNHPQEYAILVVSANRLFRHVVPQYPEKILPLKWWDDHLFVLLSKTYLESRIREQVLRGLLDELGIPRSRDRRHAVFNVKRDEGEYEINPAKALHMPLTFQATLDSLLTAPQVCR